MLGQTFITQGFTFIKPEHYLNKDTLSSLHDFKKIFDTELAEDEHVFRKRAYLKLNWCGRTDAITIAKNQHFYQTVSSNKMDGGKVRKFKIMNPDVLTIPIVKNTVTKNLQMIKACPLIQPAHSLTLGLHFIRYQVKENGASYSSPDWLHKDDELLVFIHLINLSKAAIGGDNLIADTQQKITHVLRLENEMETLVLNRQVYHAVTPLGSKKEWSCRDVLLFTVEPNNTQQ